MTIRAATPSDLAAIADVMAAAGEPMEWAGLPGWPYLEALLGRPGSRVVVATAADGTVIGMGASIPLRDGLRFLTDLFVDPGYQSAGSGRALLAAVLEEATDRATFSSSDPRALAAYVRAGMRPWWPLLYLEVPAEAADGAADRFTAEPADVATIARLSAMWSGLDHAADHAATAALPEAAGWVVRERASGAAAAVGWARRERTGPGRRLDHGSIAPDADPVGAALALIGASAAGSDRLRITIPGPHPAVPILLERGARILDRDTFCATDPTIVDPERRLPNPAVC